MKLNDPDAPVSLKEAWSRLLKCSWGTGIAIALLTALLFGGTRMDSQQQWILGQDGYFALNGKPMFLSGANYIPSRNWYFILKNWDPNVVESDMRALHGLGVRVIRFPPLWVLLQDDNGKIRDEELDHLDQLLTIANRNGISVQVEFLTGGVCGGTFLPKWADGNVFVDPKIIQREQELVRSIDGKLKDNPGLFGYDFGNELDILARRMKLNPTPEQMHAWMALMYKTSREADPAHTVAPGLAASRSNHGPFNVWDIADTTDYASIHSYAYFDGTIHSDPWIGQRTLYDMNYGIAFSAMAGKPVMVQENGFSEGWIGSQETIAKALRISLVSAWAQGAIGYLWWGSHDNDLDYRIPVDTLALKYSQPQTYKGIMNQLEYSEGLLDTANQPKLYGLEFKRWSGIISRLGVGWKEVLPVVYILQSEDSDKAFPDKKQLTAFTLAKQTHMNVKLWPESKPIPTDAAAVIVADFGLSPRGKTVVANYLNSGGTVYQSWVNDFDKDVAGADGEMTLSSPAFVVTLPTGGIPHRNTLPLFDGERLRVNADLRLRNVTVDPSQETRVLLRTLPDGQEGTKNRPVLTETKIGKGEYYYLAANLEEALAATYDPWATDQSNEIYAVLRPYGPVNIDSKYVELFQKERGNEKLLILLNRSDSFQHVMVQSQRNLQLQDYENRDQLGAGREIPLNLNPGEVLIAEVTEM